MVYYRAEAVTEGCLFEKEGDRASKAEKRKTIAKRAREFNKRHSSDAYGFVFEIEEDSIVACIVLFKPMDVEKLGVAFFNSMQVKTIDSEIVEVTLNEMESMLRDARQCEYLDNARATFQKLGVDYYESRRRSEDVRFEMLADKFEKGKVYEEVDKLFNTNTLIPELDRIYQGGTKRYVAGHPVHYMITTDDYFAGEDTTMLLVGALYSQKRLWSKRITRISINSEADWMDIDGEGIYEKCGGGTVMVDYHTGDNEEDDNASAGRFVIEELCELMKKYRNSVLTIFLLPAVCKNIKEIFHENLSDMTFVDIYDATVFYDKAKIYLEGMAKKDHIRPDKKLVNSIVEEHGYSTKELREIYADWYANKLKNTLFPQYKDIASINKKAAGKKPKGSAYEEFRNMIGLEEAKRVLDKALNYYKAQKLFAKKGMQGDRPAMHMVFTGNPGTAKTTVARLFAQIMKDNNILQRGHLVEVGRGDLVGKYVGWTATIVKKKFKEASGGVLFIDEAYSLVDDRNGSYGDEAINTIVQEMENNREDTIVIFAGYPDKMQEFMEKNPGLRSRIAFHVPFSDYSSKELCNIADFIAKKKGLKLTEEADEKLIKIFDLARAEKDFGNGRYARNIIEQARMTQATRLLSQDIDDLTNKDIQTICADDIEMPMELERRKQKSFGFVVNS